MFYGSVLDKKVRWKDRGITYVNMFFFHIKLDNGMRYSVEIDMAVCIMSLPVNLSRLNQIKSNLT